MSFTPCLTSAGTAVHLALLELGQPFPMTVIDRESAPRPGRLPQSSPLGPDPGAGNARRPDVRDRRPSFSGWPTDTAALGPRARQTPTRGASCPGCSSPRTPCISRLLRLFYPNGPAGEANGPTLRAPRRMDQMRSARLIEPVAEAPALAVARPPLGAWLLHRRAPALADPAPARTMRRIDLADFPHLHVLAADRGAAPPPCAPPKPRPWRPTPFTNPRA